VSGVAVGEATGVAVAVGVGVGVGVRVAVGVKVGPPGVMVGVVVSRGELRRQIWPDQSATRTLSRLNAARPCSSSVTGAKTGVQATPSFMM
jgi:hypothetical protein